MLTDKQIHSKAWPLPSRSCWTRLKQWTHLDPSAQLHHLVKTLTWCWCCRVGGAGLPLEVPGGSAVQTARLVVSSCQQGFCVGLVLWTLYKEYLIVLSSNSLEKNSLCSDQVNMQSCLPPTVFFWIWCRQRFGSLQRALLKGLRVWCRHVLHVNIKEVST